MSIYMDGKRTPFENIFDAVKPENPDYWHRVQAEEIGRPIADILTEWVNEHRTYYYLVGSKTNFELR